MAALINGMKNSAKVVCIFDRLKLSSWISDGIYLKQNIERLENMVLDLYKAYDKRQRQTGSIGIKALLNPSNAVLSYRQIEKVIHKGNI